MFKHFIQTLLYCLICSLSFGQETSIYCEYCFKFLSWSKNVTISNVFTSPTREQLSASSKSYRCFISKQEADEARYKALAPFTYPNSDYHIYNEQRKDECNVYRERQFDEVQKREAEAAIAEELRQKELDKQKTILDKDNFVKYFQDLDNKPNSLPNGWHEVVVIHDQELKEDYKAFVQNNKILKLAQPNLPLSDLIINIESPLIKGGRVIFQDTEKKYYEVFFKKFIENPAYVTSVPPNDLRAQAWHQMPESWQEVLGGSSQALLFAKDKAIYLRLNFSKENLDLLAIADRLEIFVGYNQFPWELINGNLAKLENPHLSNLKSLKVVVASAGFRLTFLNFTEFRQNLPKLKILTSLSLEEISLLKTGMMDKYGVFNGLKKINIDTKAMTASSLDQLSTVTRIVFPPDFIPREAKSQRTQKVGILDGELLPKLKDVYFNDNTVLSFSSHRLEHYSSGAKFDRSLNDRLFLDKPHDLSALFSVNKSIENIYACNTSLTRLWDKMKKAERELYMTEIRKLFPRLQNLSLCTKN